MKKMVALVIALMMVISTACADCLYWNEYEDNNALAFIVCGYDDEEDTYFTAIVNLDEFASMASCEVIISAYLVDAEELIFIDWDWSEDGFILYVFDAHGCEVGVVDFLPSIH